MIASSLSVDVITTRRKISTVYDSREFVIYSFKFNLAQHILMLLLVLLPLLPLSV